MSLNSFSSNIKITSTKLNQNFEGLADGSLIETGAITQAHMSDQEDWIAPTLLNSWVSYDDGATYNLPGYFKDHLGIVHLRGMLKDGSSASAVMFALPAGYRPIDRVLTVSYASTGACRIDVKADGEISATSGGSTSWTSIECITFKAEQ